ncbi:hypothetical protein VHA01S_003_00670 [Vibrio halioticoli NBRC 102217]|uniref:SPOR domain-containing protein n=1 Tax=Vibrio halioticoli NBRC 102217 TaxID=1219072 RepID=V5FDU9_9VIBR|nr:SPOR domain-containing protein [Vibrio halioticoli]GAD87991.1 hypothetical protein VHA01S_003_00670 [Vibrio halioticoli NBRC 102217]
MARKDYVKGGRTQPKKTRKPTPSKQSKKPWKMIVFAGALIGVFSYGLYSLSKTPEPQQPVDVNLTAKEESTAKKGAENLPPPPEEQWEYVKTLPEREIKVVAKEEVLPKIPYVMQCGAYRTLAQAKSRKVDIAFQGIKSEIRQKPGSHYHRVILGPYPRKRNAERDKHKLQRAKIEPCMILKDPGY